MRSETRKSSAPARSEFYKGVLIAESLQDEAVLKSIRVIQRRLKNEETTTQEQPPIWTFCTMQVPADEVEQTALRLSHALKPRAWYTNLWREGDYWLIFPDKIFHSSSTEESVWREAIEYGVSLGVPKSQLTPLLDILHAE